MSFTPPAPSTHVDSIIPSAVILYILRTTLAVTPAAMALPNTFSKTTPDSISQPELDVFSEATIGFPAASTRQPSTYGHSEGTCSLTFTFRCESDGDWHMFATKDLGQIAVLRDDFAVFDKKWILERNTAAGFIETCTLFEGNTTIIGIAKRQQSTAGWFRPKDIVMILDKGNKGQKAVPWQHLPQAATSVILTDAHDATKQCSEGNRVSLTAQISLWRDGEKTQAGQTRFWPASETYLGGPAFLNVDF